MCIVDKHLTRGKRTCGTQGEYNLKKKNYHNYTFFVVCMHFRDMNFVLNC